MNKAVFRDRYTVKEFPYREAVSKFSGYEQQKYVEWCEQNTTGPWGHENGYRYHNSSQNAGPRIVASQHHYCFQYGADAMMFKMMFNSNTYTANHRDNKAFNNLMNRKFRK